MWFDDSRYRFASVRFFCILSLKKSALRSMKSMASLNLPYFVKIFMWSITNFLSRRKPGSFINFSIRRYAISKTLVSNFRFIEIRYMLSTAHWAWTGCYRVLYKVKAWFCYFSSLPSLTQEKNKSSDISSLFGYKLKAYSRVFDASLYRPRFSQIAAKYLAVYVSCGLVVL